MNEVPLKYKAEYYAYLLVSGIVNLLPRRMALSIGATFAILGRYILTSRAKVARGNLRQAFPEKTNTEIEKLHKDVFKHIGLNSIEMLRLTKLKPNDEFEAQIEISGEENLDKALSLGKGVIFLTAHLGFWEIQSYLLSQRGYPLDFVARKLNNPLLSKLLRESRTKYGSEFIDRQRAARKIVKTLMKNRIIAIAIDQHTSPKEAIKTRFFNRPCWTTPIITQIAMKRGVPIVANFCTRTENNDFMYEIQAPIILTGDSDDPEQVRANTQLLMDVIETAIRKNIPQWFWFHRRWRAD